MSTMGGPGHPARGRFDRGNPGRALDRGQVPARRLGKRDREDGAEAVNDVLAEEEGDAQAALLDRDPLEVAGLGGAADAEERADAARMSASLPARAAGPVSLPGPPGWLSCPSFSSSVMRPSNESRKRPMPKVSAGDGAGTDGGSGCGAARPTTAGAGVTSCR
jgi:hypothetical protein